MNEGKTDPECLSVTEETNALDCLKRVCVFALQAEEDRLAWKWTVIALHSALYNFAICACRGTASLAVVQQTKKGPRLIGIEKALKLCQDDSCMRKLFSGKAIRLTSEQRKSFAFLKGIRDQFEHYRPMGWAIAYQELPYHAMHTLDVIESLTKTGTWCHPPKGFWEEVRSTIAKCRTILQESRAHREFSQMMRTGERLKAGEQTSPVPPDLAGPDQDTADFSRNTVFTAPDCEPDPSSGNTGNHT
jgi:hypothetical protein